MHEVKLDAEPSSVATARRFVADALSEAGAHGDVWSAVQAVSELATNAVVHARTSFVVRVSVSETAVRVMVVDKQPLAPVLRRSLSGETTTGRGLRLVEMLSRDWGVESAAATKMVWCEIDRVPTTETHGDAGVRMNASAATAPSSAKKRAGRRESRAVASRRHVA